MSTYFKALLFVVPMLAVVFYFVILRLEKIDIRRSLVYLAVIAVLALSGCTTIGVHDPVLRQQVIAPSPPIIVDLCVYLDDELTRADAERLLASAWSAEAEGVGIAWRITDVKRYPRPAYAHPQLKVVVDSLPLPAGCDRLMLFLGRHAGDVFYGLFAVVAPLPEVLGYVDDESRTRGYIVAQRASPLQLWLPPASTLRHELYHMLGCEHSLSLDGCYQAIERLRRQREILGYLPGWDPVRHSPIASHHTVRTPVVQPHRLNAS